MNCFKKVHIIIPLNLKIMLIDFGFYNFLQLGPKEEDVEKSVNPFVFALRFVLGALAATWFVLVPIYMWLKDQVVPKGQPI